MLLTNNLNKNNLNPNQNNNNKINNNYSEQENKIKKTTKNNKNFYDTVELTGLPNSFFETNRTNFFNNLKKMLIGIEEDSIIILQSGDENPRNDTDVVNYHFQQESNFYYLTGVVEPKFIAILDFFSKKTTLYYTVNHNERDNIFMRLPKLEELEVKYNLKVFDEIYLAQDLKIRDPKKIYFLSGINSDSDLPILTAKIRLELPYEYLKERFDYNGLIYEILADTRSRKSSEEIDYMEYIHEANVEAHKTAIKNVKIGKNERDIESDFMGYLRMNQYARSLSYEPICGCGPNSRTLHYVNNDCTLKDGNLLVLDMGIRLGGYCSDVTSTIPVNGKYSERQKSIYDLVLKANREVMSKLKPGVYWPEMHLLAESIILKGLIDLKILNNSPELTIENMLKDRVAYYFMPHGLGHFIGLECHDVGGYLSFTPKRSEKDGLKSLRTSRYLEQGNCISVEPGIYFIPFLLDKALNNNLVSKYFNEIEAKKYYDFGGVRIEDIVLITDFGFVNMTRNLPRETMDIEKLMAGN
jgi:Xaa-Pro dipeptidase